MFNIKEGQEVVKNKLNLLTWLGSCKLITKSCSNTISAMHTPMSILLFATSLTHRTSAQSESTLLKPQSNDFNSSYRISPDQISAAGISSTLANNVEVALNFERSNWASGSVHDISFYGVPLNSTNATVGSLLKLELNANASTFTLPPDTAISRIMYQSETLNGSLVPASAYILWPYLPRKMHDGYPIVSWAHATTGIFAECGPSHVRNLWYHFMVPFALVQQGYVVVAPDYQGLGVGKDAKGTSIPHPYVAAPSQANDVFYAVQAAQSAFSELSKRFVVVGHSQGGGVAWGVAQRQATRPVDGYLGAVAGSPVTNFISQLDMATGGVAFLSSLLVRGRQSFYPDFDIGTVLTAEGIKRFTLAEDIQGCNPVFSELLNNDSLIQPDYQHLPRIEAFGNATGVNGRDFAGPLLVVQGGADEVVLAAITDESVNKTCDLFPYHELEYQRYEGATHIPAMYAAQRNWLDWVEDRFEGKDVEKRCVRKEFESALPMTRYQQELTWYIEYALDTYEVQ